MVRERVRMTFWLAWILLATGAFTIVPFGPYGVIGWIGAAAPLASGILPVLNGWRVVAVAASGMVLAFLLADTGQWSDLAIPAAVLLIGVSLTPALRNGAAELQADSGGTDRGAQREFDGALTRELGRARRYGRPLTIFSATVDDRKDLGPLRDAIGSQIHIYCQMAVIDGRLLAIVPELGEKSCSALEQRIVESIRKVIPGRVWLGRASFPGDAVSGAGLIRFADAKRRAIDTFDADKGAAQAVEKPAGLESELSAP